ncbi:MAG TPA: hypothetical protein VK912_05610 [Longimicrobiales bacterium]|nr:hypothetical protein [Longimicrobiales bacterium]
MTKAVVIAALLYGVLPSVATGQGQNPSPMVETTRRHERLTPGSPAGVMRTVPGPGDRTVDVFVPAATVATERVTVVIHFHGAAWIPHQAVALLENNAVSAVVNLGAGSSVYDRAFSDPTAFTEVLRRMEREVALVLGTSSLRTDVALVAFSAGHGAVRAILRDSAAAAPVSSVLLLDGMHTSYVPAGTVLADSGSLDTRNLAEFAAFARAAISGDRRFLITHSEIFPGTFASTTETADWLLNELGLKRTAVLEWGPRGMQQLSRVQAGGFEVLGYAGNSAPDHVDHLHALPELLARLFGRSQPSGNEGRTPAARGR